MQLNAQTLVLVLFSLSTFQSGSVDASCCCGCPDVFDHFLCNALSWANPIEPRPPQTNVVFEATPQVKQWLLDNMINYICAVPNNLFVVFIKSVSSSRSYITQVVRIDPRQYVRWNSTLLNPFGSPTFHAETPYLLFSNKKLPVVKDSSKLDLGSMPALTTFIPLRDLTSTIDTVYRRWVNFTEQANSTTTEPILCLRLEWLDYLIQYIGLL
ncbi:unnamed protein product [Echinostoma caproni]|uniref:Secreted protein n=1 Tax=Echinostoma caproni TaxID=27848 RepID=A0A183B564_9TREM|nr:unnamed protein product [Echinostoma caproni]